MPTATITTKGQITIPKEIRDHLGIAAGDRVEFLVDEQGTVVLRPSRRVARELYGLLKRRGGRTVAVEEMDAEVAEVMAEDQERVGRRE